MRYRIPAAPPHGWKSHKPAGKFRIQSGAIFGLYKTTNPNFPKCVFRTCVTIKACLAVVSTLSLSLSLSAFLPAAECPSSPVHTVSPSRHGGQRLLVCTGCSPVYNPCVRLCHRSPLASATQYSLCRICGAPKPAAQVSTAPKEYASFSRSADTRSIQSRPSLLATCSPRITSGLHWRMSSKNTGHKCLSSENPFLCPAAENGWQGQLPVQTGSSSFHPACRSAYAHVPIPAKKWHWVNLARSAGSTSLISLSSTSPSGIAPALINSRSHCAEKGSFSL